MRAFALSLVLPLLAFCGCGTAVAQETSYPSFDFGGLVFGDAYYIPSHHLQEGDDAAGLVMRRTYLTLDVDFSERWFGRARLEFNQSGEFETYEFDGDWKDLYVGAKLGRHEILAGLTGTPTFDLIEKIWGARYLMRTPMDLQGIASRDTGIFAKGPINTSGTLAYRAMWAAPVEFGAESNENQRVMGAVSWSPTIKWTFDFYADYEEREDAHDRKTMQAFMAYETELIRWGLQYSNQDRQEDPPLELASGFIAAKLGEKSSLIGRIDRLIEPSPRGDDISYIPFDPSAPATLYVGAYEYQLSPNFTLTPNLIVVNYDRDDQGQKATTDIYVRLTAFFTF